MPARSPANLAAPPLLLPGCWLALGCRLALGCWLALVGCQGRHPELQSEAKSPDLPVLRAALLKIEPQAWPTIVRAQGSLIAEELATIGAKVQGRVETVHVDLGDEVRQGQPLVTLERRELELLVVQAEALLLQARAAIGLAPEDDAARADPLLAPPVREAQAVWDEARQQAERLRQLFASKAISEQEWEQAVAAESVAAARSASALNGVREKLALISVRAAELAVARQRLEEIVTPAPFDGLVQQRHVAPGTYVHVGEPLATLAHTSALRFRGSVPERFAQSLRSGQRVTLRIESFDEPCTVSVTRISPALDEQTRSLVFEAALENPQQQYRAGLFGEAEIVLDPDAVAIAVPRSAVVRFAGVEKVWKVVDGVTRSEAVQLGREMDGRIEVLLGLASGDVVLLNGEHGRVARIEVAASASSAKDGNQEAE